MTLPDNDAELEALMVDLDPTARVIIRLFRKSTNELKAILAVRDEQLAEFQRMLFGKRSKKLLPIESVVRRAIEADELAVDDRPVPTDPKEKKARDKARQTQRRRIARKKSEPARKLRRGLRKNLPIVHEQCIVQSGELPEGYAWDDFRELGDGATIRRIEHVREHIVCVEYRMQTLAAHIVVEQCVDSLSHHAGAAQGWM